MLGIKGACNRVATGRRIQPLRVLNNRVFYYSSPLCHTPLPSVVWKEYQRHRSTAPDIPKSGHIEEGPNESLLFIDNIFPLRLNFLLGFTGLPFFTDPEKILQKLLTQLHKDQRIPAADPLNIAQKALPETLSIQVRKILPRLKEGGAYAKFSHDPNVTPSDIEAAIQEYLEKKSPKPWFNPFRGISSHLVRGRPWLEDLQRFPSKRLKVEFLPTSPGAEAAELPEETLYTLFRTYGKLGDITPQPTGSKDLPKYAILNY
ncbi:MAG: hypothetical protein Q9225_008045, partial [Loekoesia sp. 1 TL-2023]